MSFLSGLFGGGAAETANLAVRLSLQNNMSSPLKEAESSIGGLNKTTGGLASTLKSNPISHGILQGVGLGAGLVAFTAISAVVGDVVGGIGDAIKGGEELQATDAKLNTALTDNVSDFASSATATAAYSDQIDAAVKAGEALAFNQVEQKDALTQLVARTQDVSQAVNLLSLAEDLSRAKGIDLATSVGVIGKVYSGNVGILTRYGIAVQKGATATQALAQVQKAVAGQAQTYADTIVGQQQAIGDEFQAIEAKAGEMLAGPLLSVEKFVAGPVLDSVENLISGVGNLGTAFDNLHRFIDPDYAAMEDLRKGALTAASAFGVSADALEAYIEAQQNTTKATKDAIQTDQQEQYARQGIAASLGISLSAYENILAAQNAANNSTDDGTTSLHNYQAEQKGVVDNAQNMELEANKTIQWMSIQADAANALALHWQDSVDRQEAAVATVPGALTDMSRHGITAIRSSTPAMDAALDRLYTPISAKAKFAAQVAGEDVGKIPVLMSDQLKGGIGLVKAAMAEYELAITEPVTVAKERTAIEAALTSKKIRDGLKSKNPVIRADAVELVAWLEKKLNELNGLKVTIKGEVFETGAARQGIGKPQARAAGGPVDPGQTYVVNEHGIEYLHMGNQGGYIDPHPKGGHLAVTVNTAVSLSAQAAARKITSVTMQHGVIAT